MDKKKLQDRGGVKKLTMSDQDKIRPCQSLLSTSAWSLVGHQLVIILLSSAAKMREKVGCFITIISV